MLCVITHIFEDVHVDAKGDHMKQVNAVINTLFHGISDDEMNDTLDTFYNECDAFN